MRNEKEGRVGAQAFSPAKEAVDAIRTTRRPSPARLRSWIHHPDEVVPATLAQEHLRAPVWSRRWDSTCGPELFQRARADADEEGLLWTPLLDLASQILDPEGVGSGTPPLELFFYIQELDPGEKAGILEGLSTFGCLPLVREVARSIDKPPPPVMRRILGRKGGALGLSLNPSIPDTDRHHIATHVLRDLKEAESTGGRGPLSEVWARGIQTALIFENLKDRGWKAWDDLIRGLLGLVDPLAMTSASTPSKERSPLEIQLAATLSLCVLENDEGVQALGALISEKKIPLNELAVPWLGKRGLLSPEIRREVLLRCKSLPALTELASLGSGFSETEVQLLLFRGVISSQTRGGEKHHPSDFILSSLENNPGSTDTVRQAARGILTGTRIPGVPVSGRARPEALKVLLALARREEDLLGLDPVNPPEKLGGTRLLGHPFAGPRLWREMLQWSREGDWHEALAAAPRARRHPDIRPLLLETRDPAVYQHLAMDGVSEEMPVLLPLLVEWAPALVVDYLTSAPGRVLSRLDPVILTPLLASEDDRIRQVVFEALARVGGE